MLGKRRFGSNWCPLPQDLFVRKRAPDLVNVRRAKWMSRGALKRMSVVMSEKWRGNYSSLSGRSCRTGRQPARTLKWGQLFSTEQQDHFCGVFTWRKWHMGKKKNDRGRPRRNWQKGFASLRLRGIASSCRAECLSSALHTNSSCDFGTVLTSIGGNYMTVFSLL